MTAHVNFYNLIDPVCAPTDWACRYKQTNYLLSDTKLHCYTPAIPSGKRHFDPRLLVRLVLNDGRTHGCRIIPNCWIMYKSHYTPTLYSFDPRHFEADERFGLKIKRNSLQWGNLVKIQVICFIN